MLNKKKNFISPYRLCLWKLWMLSEYKSSKISSEFFLFTALIFIYWVRSKWKKLFLKIAKSLLKFYAYIHQHTYPIVFLLYFLRLTICRNFSVFIPMHFLYRFCQFCFIQQNMHSNFNSLANFYVYYICTKSVHIYRSSRKRNKSNWAK